jgi:hypothetical protein
MSKEYTPLVIAKSFTKQYYEIIHKKPQQLYRFYKEESNFFHGDANEASINWWIRFLSFYNIDLYCRAPKPSPVVTISARRLSPLT